MSSPVQQGKRDKALPKSAQLDLFLPAEMLADGLGETEAEPTT